jgi:hypothetical protein
MQTGGGEERGEVCHPSGLLCWLTVIWSGAPPNSLGEVPTKYEYRKQQRLEGGLCRLKQEWIHGLGSLFDNGDNGFSAVAVLMAEFSNILGRSGTIKCQ